MARIKNCELLGKLLMLQERKLIENGLQEGMTFRSISQLVAKDRRTVSKEIRRNHSLQNYDKKRANVGYQ